MTQMRCEMLAKICVASCQVIFYVLICLHKFEHSCHFALLTAQGIQQYFGGVSAYLCFPLLHACRHQRLRTRCPRNWSGPFRTCCYFPATDPVHTATKTSRLKNNCYLFLGALHTHNQLCSKCLQDASPESGGITVNACIISQYR